jgi:hypothetical protein
MAWGNQYLCVWRVKNPCCRAIVALSLRIWMTRMIESIVGKRTLVDIDVAVLNAHALAAYRDEALHRASCRE